MASLTNNPGMAVLYGGNDDFSNQLLTVSIVLEFQILYCYGFLTLLLSKCTACENTLIILSTHIIKFLKSVLVHSLAIHTLVVSGMTAKCLFCVMSESW